jgi:hypothetical protein
MLSLRAPRPRMTGPVARALVLALLIGSTLGACSGSSTGAARPTTRADLEIVSPAPNAQTGADVDLQMRLTGASVVPSTQVGGRLRSDRGHIHVSVDGQLVAMPYTLDQVIPGLTPGTHTIQAEFVATDHLPFANRVLSTVTFTVQ